MTEPIRNYQDLANSKQPQQFLIVENEFDRLLVHKDKISIKLIYEKWLKQEQKEYNFEQIANGR